MDICGSNIEKEKHEIQLKENSTMNIRKKNLKQHGYFSTKKKPTTNTRFSNPTIIELQNIKESLLSNDEIVFVSTDFDHSYCKKMIVKLKLLFFSQM